MSPAPHMSPTWPVQKAESNHVFTYHFRLEISQITCTCNLGVETLLDDLAFGVEDTGAVIAGWDFACVRFESSLKSFGVNIRGPVSISEKQASELKKPQARLPEPLTMA
jgi:hypothetical protein